MAGATIPDREHPVQDEAVARLFESVRRERADRAPSNPVPQTPPIAKEASSAAEALPSTAGADARNNDELHMMRWGLIGMLALGLLAAVGVIVGMTMTTFDVPAVTP